MSHVYGNMNIGSLLFLSSKSVSAFSILLEKRATGAQYVWYLSISGTKIRISEQKNKFYLSFFERERSAMPLLPSEATKRIFGEAKNTKNRAKYQINAY